MRKFGALLVLVVILAGGGYYVYRRGWKLPFSGSGVASPADIETTAKVKAALSLSKRISAFNIGVKTDGGVVSLTGEVSSEDMKSLAGEITRDTTGVKDVKNDIAINPGAGPSAEQQHVEDLEIKTSILEAINHSAELGGKHIDVRVESHQVTLSGAVDNPVQRNGAEQIARSVAGVAGVTNQLTVANAQAPTEPPTANRPSTDPNTDLAKRVEFELYRTGAFDVQTMHITAADGIVSLGGTVRSRAEQLLAIHTVEGVDGVKKVTDELKVAPAVKH